jgi:hypothetical protein
MKGLLKDISPEVAKEWHPTKNTLDINLISNGNPKKAWWLGACQHEWEATVAERTRIRADRANQGGKCPYCTGKKVLAGFNDLATVNPVLAKEWHPTKNGLLTPTEVTAGQRITIWWQCKLGHDWPALIYSRSQNTDCPICSGKQVLAGFNDLLTLRPDLAAQWHPTKNTLLPTEVTAGQRIDIWWLGGCGHEWNAKVSSRSEGKSCSICTNKIVVLGINDLATINPRVALEWHPTKNHPLTPHDVSGGYTSRAWWQCTKGHEWETTVSKRHVKGTNCPHCSNQTSKPEQAIQGFLADLNLEIVAREKTILKGKELDLYFPTKNFAIEYNGLYWHTEAQGKTEYYHYDKWLQCKQQGIQLFQIWEDDWLRNPELIKRILSRKLGSTLPIKELDANDTTALELDSTLADEFLNEHHLQGKHAAAKYIGLVTKSNNTLVAVMALTVEAKVIEINRFASTHQITNGFNNLLRFGESLSPNAEEIIAYSDNNHSMGNVYATNGFRLANEGTPSCFYIYKRARVHHLDFTEGRFEISPELIFQQGLTVSQLATLNRFDSLWDAGSSLWTRSITESIEVTK